MAISSFNYAPGGHSAIFAWPVCVLVRLPPTDPRVGWAYAALTNDPTPSTALAELAGVPLGILTVEPSGVRLILQGNIMGQLGGGATLFGPLDTVVDEYSQATLLADGGTGATVLPAAYGVVAAGQVGIGWLPDGAPEPVVDEASFATALVTPLSPLSVSPFVEPSHADMVTAVFCQFGHANPVYAGRCRVCQAPIAPQPLTRVRRPALGLLRASNGLTLSLDRAAVFGRNPRPIPGVDANVVRLEDPGMDISSQHLMVDIGDWLVTVCDLGSTNGTQIVAPGAAPVALRPNEPVTIEPGTVVVLAHVFDLVYEAG